MEVAVDRATALQAEAISNASEGSMTALWIHRMSQVMDFIGFQVHESISEHRNNFRRLLLNAKSAEAPGDRLGALLLRAKLGVGDHEARPLVSQGS